MILDELTLVSDDQNLAQTFGSTYYSDVLNLLGDPGYTTSQDAPNGITNDLGKGYPVELLAQVTETFTSGGSATVTVTLETDDNEGFSSAETLYTSKAFSMAELVAGKHVLPQHFPFECQQYLRIGYAIGTADTTAGKITAGVVCGHQSNK